MITLHYYPSTASMAPHIVLEEIGCAYQRVLVDRMQGAHKTPEYLRLNPNGLIPVLTDGRFGEDFVLYETAAILLHLADTHPDRHPMAQLAPAVGTAERAHFYKWLMWFTNTLQAALIVYFYPERWVAAGNASGMQEVKTQAQNKIGGMLGQIDAQLASHGQDWFLGQNYSALDAYALMLCRWTRGFDAAAGSAPARTHGHIAAYLERMLARPAVQRVMAVEGLERPWV
jgi:glutathione S-transferase